MPEKLRYGRVRDGMTKLFEACSSAALLSSAPPPPQTTACDQVSPWKMPVLRNIIHICVLPFSQYLEALDGGDECRVCGRSEVEHDARAWVKQQLQSMQEIATARRRPCALPA